MGALMYAGKVSGEKKRKGTEQKRTTMESGESGGRRVWARVGMVVDVCACELGVRECNKA